jgi:hypothetical protein
MENAFDDQVCVRLLVPAPSRFQDDQMDIAFIRDARQELIRTHSQFPDMVARFEASTPPGGAGPRVATEPTTTPQPSPQAGERTEAGPVPDQTASNEPESVQQDENLETPEVDPPATATPNYGPRYEVQTDEEPATHDTGPPSAPAPADQVSVDIDGDIIMDDSRIDQTLPHGSGSSSQQQPFHVESDLPTASGLQAASSAGIQAQTQTEPHNTTRILHNQLIPDVAELPGEQRSRSQDDTSQTSNPQRDMSMTAAAQPQVHDDLLIPRSGPANGNCFC